jgi:hypothetical protein
MGRCTLLNGARPREPYSGPKMKIMPKSLPLTLIRAAASAGVPGRQ